MNTRNILSLLRRIILRLEKMATKQGKSRSPFTTELYDLDSANKKISQLLEQDGGVMIARYGNTEMLCVANYLGIKSGHHPLRYISGRQEAWWWNPKYLEMISSLSGFYPATQENLKTFSELMIRDTEYLDFLGSWIQNERLLTIQLSDVPKTRLQFLESYFSKNPWSASLKGKKVLVVHPFAKSIQSQYTKREFLFENPDILPEFASLHVIPAVQSIANGDARFKNWFEALEWMKSEIDSRDYDVCLIGCGAYGFPLAAHVKRQGKKAVHLGGALQLLFGIRGRRWEDINYGINAGFKPGQYASLPNNYWIRPSDDERPAYAEKVENACYW